MKSGVAEVGADSDVADAGVDSDYARAFADMGGVECDEGEADSAVSKEVVRVPAASSQDAVEEDLGLL